ncbi:MAG: methionine adenosyltransferase [Candidatus Marinimicrobia bacterium]|jgi:S-adenosylmethionine synthetase|nr:methionine adenosyltransferase [Candidatus Neomarinimicrobiota bacterium]MBP9005522.1 methionine adenosyltransferase [Candidatus Neomarinimicrobiota bacterium]HOD37440.1 methionine adenosyltransferase [Candidatus Neomarinimicrobiota bacterium]HOU16680.1 methionine adenosyltransferase [Candidatus Neomarinimicrobiota bacterium]HPA99331.1 methionine adenosyltransferase [Candidatus Neomarinimicrobiota bacterium]
MKKYSFTSESVTEGHPDKICDQVSDAILDALLTVDPESRVACETMTTTGLVMVVGEITTKAYVDIPRIVRETIEKIGYTDPDFGLDARSCAVITSIHEQSENIALGVNETEKHEQGAGDQGLMFGYACDETPELMPLPISMANKLTMRLAEVRKKGILNWVRPDGKSQVTVEYEDDHPKRITNVVVAVHHNPEIAHEKIVADIKNHVILPVCQGYLTPETKFYINATGIFAIGGPEADSGVTGRKIICDTYGGMGRHGGGAFSGKDPSKVDRSASYMARYIAKNIVAAGLARRCEVQLAYSIGVADPISVYINTSGTGKQPEERLAEAVRAIFPLKPAAIIKYLCLKRPIYLKTAAYGHFGREDEEFSWEKTDKVAELKQYFGVK